MTITRFTQIFNNTATLQAAGGTHTQNSLRITCSTITLRTEAAFTPQYRLTYHPLSQIIRRLYLRIMHKRPQILPLIKNTATRTRQRLTTVGTFFQQAFHSLHQRLHTTLKRQSRKSRQSGSCMKGTAFVCAKGNKPAAWETK